MKQLGSDTAVNSWLLNGSWVAQKNKLSGTLLIQNVVNDEIALITHAEWDNDELMWIVSYYYNGENYVQWACELWNWRVIESD